MSCDATGAASEAKVLACEKCQELLNVFGEAVHALLFLIEYQFQGVLNDDPGCGNLNTLIAVANLKRQEAKEAYLLHAKTHAEARSAA
jgi:hypothetical protein